MRSHIDSFLNQLFSYKIRYEKDHGIYFLEEDDIINYYKSKSIKSIGFFDQDKILNFVDDQNGLITRESFERGIYEEYNNMNNELNEINEKRLKADQIIQEKKLSLKLGMQLMSQQEREYCEDDNFIMKNAQFSLKIVCVDKSNGSNINSNQQIKKEKVRIQIDIDNDSYSSEERIMDEGPNFFSHNNFTLPISTGYEKIFLKVVEDEYSEVKGSIQIKLSDFKDQKIHKRTYHLKPQKKYRDYQYDIQVRAFYYYNNLNFNRDKLAMREETYYNILSLLKSREIKLNERLQGIQNCSSHLILEYLDLICFNEGDDINQKNNDTIIRVEKDYDSETASVYNSENQQEIFFSKGDEEIIEFKRYKPYSNTHSPRSDHHGNFSFDHMSDDDNDINNSNNMLGTPLRQIDINPLIHSNIISSTDINKQNETSMNSPFKLNLSSQQGISDLAQFISPRFQNEIASQRQSIKHAFEENNQPDTKVLIELKALSRDTQNLINQYHSKKNQIQAEIKIKNNLYSDLSNMSQKDLIKFRIFARSVYAMEKLNKQDSLQLKQQQSQNHNKFLKY